MRRLFFAAVAALFSAAAPLWAQTFYPLPSVDGSVKAFAAHGTTLYVGGNFDTMGGQTRHGLAAIDLTTGAVTSWNPDPTSGGAKANITSIAISADGSKIYFSGTFDLVKATARTYVAEVDAAGAVQSFAPVFNGGVSQVIERDGSLYAIGDFNTVDGNARKGFVGFDVSGAVNAFDPAPAGFNTSTSFRGASLSADGAVMYVSLGNSAGIDVVDVNNAAILSLRGLATFRLTDGRQTLFQPPINDGASKSGTFAVATYGEKLYVGGDFDNFNTYGVDDLLSFNSEVFDGSFSPETGTGPDDYPRAITSDGNTVYIAGQFGKIGGVDRLGLAALDPATGALISTWDPQLGVKLGGVGTVVFVYDGKVFIGGVDLNNATTLLNQNIQYYGALSAVPMPVTVTSTVTAPTVKVSGKSKITTIKSKLTIKGTATGTVTSVGYKVGSKSGVASGTNAWSFPAKLKTGKNVITVTAKGPGGTSTAAKVTVTKK